MAILKDTNVSGDLSISGNVSVNGTFRGGEIYFI